MKTIRRGEFDFVVYLRFIDMTLLQRVRCSTTEYLKLESEIAKAVESGKLASGEIMPWETMPVRSPKTIRSLMEG